MLIKKEESRTWEPTGIDGISTSVLWNNPDGDGAYFAQFKAGANFPLHEHDGWEQIFIISGMIRFGQVTLAQGDFLQVDSNDEHDAFAIDDTILFVSHRGGIRLKTLSINSNLG